MFQPSDENVVSRVGMFYAMYENTLNKLIKGSFFELISFVEIIRPWIGCQNMDFMTIINKCPGKIGVYMGSTSYLWKKISYNHEYFHFQDSFKFIKMKDN